MPQDNSQSNKKSTRWFRFYGETVDDPKAQRLPPTLFKSWVNLLCIASQNGGSLPSLEDIAFKLRLDEATAQEHIDELIRAGLIDDAAGVLEPHNWNGRQYVSDNSTERVRKHRKKKDETDQHVDDETPWNVSLKQECNVSVTPPDTETESDTDTEPDKKNNIQTNLESVAAREPDPTVVPLVRPSDHFLECKKAFNGSTSDMLAEIAQHMNANPDEAHVSQWLASLLRANGTEAVQQSYQMLLTARAEQKPIARVLPWWSKTAATLKANPAVKPKKPAYMMRY